MMKQSALLLMTLLLAATATAQVDREAYERQRQQMREQFEREKNQMRKQYDEERRKAEEEFAAFRQKANEEYAAAVRQAWTQMGVEPAVPKPKEPEPPKPPKPPVDKIPTTIPLVAERGDTTFQARSRATTRRFRRREFDKNAEIL